MSTNVIISPVDSMWQNRCSAIQKFGKDQTGTIEYRFNSQGFRNTVDYNFIPDYALFGCSIVFGVGVSQNNTFAGRFKSIHNYGLADTYTNADCFSVIDQFVKSKWYSQQTKLAVIWSPRNQDLLGDYLEKLQQYQMIHFFCGNRLNLPNCYNLTTNLDYDVSNTHPGPQTHKFIYLSLCQLFDQL